MTDDTDDLVAWLRAEQADHDKLWPSDDSTIFGEAADEIERLRVLVEHYRTDTELQSTRRLLAWRTDQRDEKIAALKNVVAEILDVPDPKAQGGHCMFCSKPIGSSIFGSELTNPARHEPDCRWLDQQRGL